MSFLKVTFIDVGHGDCVLFRSQMMTERACYFYDNCHHCSNRVLLVVGGIMRNYVTEFVKQGRNYQDVFYDIASEEAWSVPNWVTWINMTFDLARSN